MLQQSTAYTDDDVYISGLVVEFGDTEKQEHVCVQDMFSSRLLTMTITEFLVPKLSYLGTAAAKRALRDRGVTHWLGRKDPFQLEKNVTHLIYFQSLLWLLQPMYPLAAVLGPLLLVADFKFDKAYLIRCSSKSAPFAGSQTLFLLFNVLSLAVFALFWGFLWAFDPSVTECVPAAGVYEGPFQPDTSGASGYAQTSPSRDFTARGSGLATVVDVAFHPTVLVMGMDDGAAARQDRRLQGDGAAGVRRGEAPDAAAAGLLAAGAEPQQGAAARHAQEAGARAEGLARRLQLRPARSGAAASGRRGAAVGVSARSLRAAELLTRCYPIRR